MMDTFVVQLYVLLILFLGNVVFGSCPYLFGKILGFYSGENWNRQVKSSLILSYFGAGILISNTFIILLPQANHEFEKPKNHSHRFNGKFSGNISGNLSVEKSAGHSGHHHDSFPIPELTVLCGFFLAFMIQEFACHILMKISRNSVGSLDLQDRFCTCAKRLTECSRTFKDVKPDQTLFGMEKKLLESVNAPCSTGAASNILPIPETTAKSDLLRSSVITQSIPNYGAVTNAAEPLPIDNPLPVLTPPDIIAEERLLLEKYSEAEDRYKFLISSTLIVVELALQLIISGMQLGLQSENCKNWSRLSLFFLQNFLLVFCAGSYLAAGGMELYCLGLFISLLSTVSPSGMIVSMVAKDSVERIPHLAKGVISSIVSGALLFSIFTDFLKRKDSKHLPGLVKFLALIFGAGAMAALQYGVLIM